VIYSALLEIECPIPEIIAAAGLSQGATFGQVILSLMDQLEAARRTSIAAHSDAAFRPIAHIDVREVLKRIAVLHLQLCDECCPKLRATVVSLGAAGLLPPEDPPDERVARELEDRLLN
jgi:hypothetical protein